MGSGASTVEQYKGKTAEEIQTALAGASDAEKAHWSAAYEAAGCSDSQVTNRKNITENEALIHELFLAVTTNKEAVYKERSMIEGNRDLIMKNYSAAFVGNRQMANQNTDDIFKNRTAILDTLKIEGAVQENFRNTKYNEANVDYLENRSLLNNRVAKANAKMSELNQELIAINNKIMESNEEIVNFNATAIDTNKKLLEAGILPEKTTPEANTARIKANAEKIAMIQSKAGKYDKSVDDQLKHALENREKINKNAEDIRDRRHKIKANRQLLLANGDKVVENLRNQ